MVENRDITHEIFNRSPPGLNELNALVENRNVTNPISDSEPPILRQFDSLVKCGDIAYPVLHGSPARLGKAHRLIHHREITHPLGNSLPPGFHKPNGLTDNRKLANPASNRVPTLLRKLHPSFNRDTVFRYPFPPAFRFLPPLGSCVLDTNNDFPNGAVFDSVTNRVKNVLLNPVTNIAEDIQHTIEQTKD